jgi:hypothetical protein
MSERQPALLLSGFGLRIVPFAGRPFRARQAGNELTVESRAGDDWHGATVTTTNGLANAPAELSRSAEVGPGPSTNAWWIEASTYRIPLPASWMLHASGEPTAAPLFELLAPAGASISVRTARRMPSIEAFQGDGHVFRDVGQLDRAGWIEFEHADASGAWLYRHEQLHRGTSPFIVTLKAQLDDASVHMDALACIVEQLELTSR